MLDRVRPLLLLPLALTLGCLSFGYARLTPTQAEPYQDFLEPLPPGRDYWIQGRIGGDLGGDQREEEAIVASVHRQGKKRGALEKAVLLICRPREDAPPELVLRRDVLRMPATLQETPLPAHVLRPRPKVALRHCGLTIAETDEAAHRLLFVSVWNERDDSPAQVWHAGYRLEGDRLALVFAVLARQYEPGVEAVDIDKDGVQELLVSQAVLPQELLTAAPELPRPRWLSVYRRDEAGMYVQDDKRYGEAYPPLLLAWMRHYALALQQQAPATTLATLEYYIGRIHLYAGHHAPARRFLRLAATRETEPPLRAAIAETLQELPPD